MFLEGNLIDSLFKFVDDFVIILVGFLHVFHVFEGLFHFLAVVGCSEKVINRVYKPGIDDVILFAFHELEDVQDGVEVIQLHGVFEGFGDGVVLSEWAYFLSIGAIALKFEEMVVLFEQTEYFVLAKGYKGCVDDYFQ